tara:strand:- start:721 stop:912 length:192 start_codon:yes stop_codon:yes gene_type:complete
LSSFIHPQPLPALNSLIVKFMFVRPSFVVRVMLVVRLMPIRHLFVGFQQRMLAVADGHRLIGA